MHTVFFPALAAAAPTSLDRGEPYSRRFANQSREVTIVPLFERVGQFPNSSAEINELGKWWCPGAESNHRHCDFQSHALPTELPGHPVSPNGERSERAFIGGDGGGGKPGSRD